LPLASLTPGIAYRSTLHPIVASPAPKILRADYWMRFFAPNEVDATNLRLTWSRGGNGDTGTSGSIC